MVKYSHEEIAMKIKTIVVILGALLLHTQSVHASWMDKLGGLLADEASSSSSSGQPASQSLLSNDEISKAFKQALDIGSQQVVEQLAKTVSADATAFTLPGFAETNNEIYGKLADAKAQASTQQPATKTSDPEKASSVPSLSASELPETIFRAYDIRGIAETELTDAVIKAIGTAIGSEALDQGQQTTRSG